jgi:hypothetical protein
MKRSRKSTAALLALAVALCGATLGSCAKGKAEAAPKPGLLLVLTPPESAAGPEFRAAEALAGQGLKGGLEVSHLAFPDKPKGESGIAAFIADAAADPRIKAVVVVPAPLGTAEGFRRAKEARGKKADLLCIAALTSDDELSIEASADLVVDLDRSYRAYIVAWEAKKMGAGALVAAYEREEDSSSATMRERAIQSAAAADLGLRYASKTAPEGVQGADFARSGTGAWLREYGHDTAFYCSSRTLAPVLISGAIGGGGMVVDLAGSATTAAYAKAFGVDLSGAKGDAKKERALVEAAAAAVGMKGRLGLWDLSIDEAAVPGLAEYAIRVMKGQAAKAQAKDLAAALDAGGSLWIAEYDIDPSTGVKSANRILLRQDVYVLGKGYLQSALQQVPPKYLRIEAAQ